MSIETYLNELRAKKLSPHSIRNYQQTLEALDAFKPLDTVTKLDLIEFFKQFKGSESSILLAQVILKKYFKDVGKPEVIAWIKYIKPKEKLQSKDIISPDDINKMIDATESHYWKAVIAFLYETGCRISEAQAIRYKDLQDTDSGMIVNIPTTKTAAGYRKVILPFSSQYIRNLRTFCNCKKEDYIFHICYSHTYHTLNEIAKKAGIEKPISPHKFRHAQATDMVRRNYNEAIIRKKLGWVPTSGMIARYQHLNDEDVINATLENVGRLPVSATPRVEIKEAERVSLVDAAMQFSKLSEENEALKAEMASIKEMLTHIKRITRLDTDNPENTTKELQYVITTEDL